MSLLKQRLDSRLLNVLERRKTLKFEESFLSAMMQKVRSVLPVSLQSRTSASLLNPRR